MPTGRGLLRGGNRSRVQPLLGAGVEQRVGYPVPIFPASQIKTFMGLSRALTNTTLGLEIENTRTWEGLR